MSDTVKYVLFACSRCVSFSNNIIIMFSIFILFPPPSPTPRPAPVKWAQRGDLVYLHFEVQDVSNPDVKVEPTKVTYR